MRLGWGSGWVGGSLNQAYIGWVKHGRLVRFGWGFRVGLGQVLLVGYRGFRLGLGWLYVGFRLGLGRSMKCAMTPRLVLSRMALAELTIQHRFLGHRQLACHLRPLDSQCTCNTQLVSRQICPRPRLESVPVRQTSSPYCKLMEELRLRLPELE